MSPLVRRFGPLVVCAVAIVAVVGTVAQGVSGPGRGRQNANTRPRTQVTAAQRAKLDRKAQRFAERRFDAPDLAVEFYVNKRTGPIITRGANLTVGARPLSPAAYLPALQQMRAMPRYSSATGAVLPSYDDAPDVNAAPGAALLSWSNLGPGNQGGRTRAMIIDPSNNDIMYAGGVGGGVWKSVDAGANWLPLADLQMSNIAVASLAFDPLNANTIYAGTGEGFFNGDAIRGAGIFRSTNAGATWSQLPATNNSNFFYVNSLVVSPRNSLRMFAATRAGIFRSIDGGNAWTSLVSGTAVNGCTQVVMQVSGPSGFVFASCGNFAQGTVYRVPDDDVSALSSVLSLASMGRSSIAIAPSNQAVVYVMAAQGSAAGGPGQHGLHGIYRSTSNGDLGSFTTQVNGTVAPVGTAQRLNQALLSNPVYAFLADCGFGTTQFFNQGWYDNVIAVDPLDANRVWAGGVDLFRSDDGGLNWGTAGYWWSRKGIDPQYHHADQHGIVFHPQYNGTTNRIMFSASDGGVERIDDARAPVNNTVGQICGAPVAGSPTWVDRNNGYVTTQFYDGAVYPNGLTYFGGLQDNGTQRGASGSPTWTTLTGGDGGYVAVDILGDANAANDVLFAEFTGLSIQKSVNGGATFAAATSGISDSGFLFIAPFTMNQGLKQHLWAGGDYVWRTTNQATGAGSWTRASALTAGAGSVSAVAAHPLDGNRVIVGMSDGYIHSNTAALTATSVTAWPFTRPSTGYISSLAWDPTNVNVAFATVSGFGVTNLFKTTDGGVSWLPSVGIGVTSLPQIPALSVVVNPTDSLQVFVGTDLGVFTSVDGGVSWYVENTGFSNVTVESLKFNETAPHSLFAFTHGRGAWRVALNPGGVVPPTAANDSYGTAHNTPLVVPPPGVLGNDSANGGGTMTAVLDTTVSVAAGTLALSPTGGFTYTPATGFSGPATFTYHATNTNGPGNIATVTIAVAAATPPPTAVADSYATAFNTALTVAAPGVLGNDNANGGGTMTAVLNTTVSAAAGTLSLGATGGFTYTPTSGFSGAATFTYHVTNANGASNIATATITVAAPPPPTAVNDSYGTPYQTLLTVAAPGVLGNDASNGGGAMTAQVVATAANGALALAANGSFTYTPNAGFSGGDSFTYRATNSGGPGNTATVTISVGAPAGPPPPTSANDTYSATEGTPLSVAAPAGVLANDTSNGGGAMTAVVVANPASGTLTLGPDGAFVYTPAPGFTGADTFTYRASNISGPGNVATVSIAVAAITTPQPPSNFRIIRMSGSTVTFAWTLPTIGPAPASLQLEGGFTPGSVLGALPLGVTPSVTVALPSGSFYIRLRTLAAGQTSAASNEVLTHVNVPVAPSAPTNLLGFTNGSALGLAWTPTFDGGEPTGATLEVSGTLSGSLPLGAADSFSFGAVPPGTYAFTVRQNGAGGTSVASSPVTLTFPGACSGAPQVPANFLAFKSGGDLFLSWDPPVSGTAPTGYVLNVTGSFVGALPMASRSFSGPGPAGTFNLSVIATNPCGASPPTATRTVSFP